MIEADGLEKRYGERRALRPLTFTLAERRLLVVTGANGAGKTTLLRLLAGLASPSAGTLAVAADRRSIGFLGHEPLVYADLTGRENLRLYADLYRLADRPTMVSEALERVGLAGAADERARAYSRGMTQRLGLARALLHRPQLVILDEPHTALDSDGAAHVDGVLEELCGEVTVVVATHDPERMSGLAGERLELRA